MKQAVAPFVKMTEKRIRKKNLTKKTHKNVLKVLVMVKSMVRKFWTQPNLLTNTACGGSAACIAL